MEIGQQDGQRLEPDDLGFQGSVLAPADPLRSPEPDVDLAGQQARHGPGHAAAVHPAEVDVGRRIAGGFEDGQPGSPAIAQEIRDVGSGGGAELPPRGVVQSEELAGANEQALARRRQRDAPRRPDEELRPELALESTDVAAQGLLGDEEPRRSAREVELLRRRDEVAQRPQVELTSDRRRFVIHAIGRLIPRVKVLDLGPRRCEAGPRKPTHPQRRKHMFDGATLGTLMIGLETVRKNSEWSEPSVRRPARRSRPASSLSRVRLASALRSVADRLDRKSPAALGSSSSAA